MEIESLTMQVLTALFVFAGIFCMCEHAVNRIKAKREANKPKPMAVRVMAGLRPVYPNHEVKLRWLHEGTEYAVVVASMREAREAVWTKVHDGSTGVRISYFDEGEGCEAIMYMFADGEFHPYGQLGK